MADPWDRIGFHPEELPPDPLLPPRPGPFDPPEDMVVLSVGDVWLI